MSRLTIRARVVETVVTTRSEIPEGLVTEIKHGRCIAFVGAGFSAASDLPSWPVLIERLVDDDGVSPDVREYVQQLLESSRSRDRSRDLEAAAQMTKDALGPEPFRQSLRRLLEVAKVPTPMKRRLWLLRRIPFRTVLTTNFDGYLRGDSPRRDVYLRILRPEDTGWWERRYWDDSAPGSNVVKLHGDVEGGDVVFTTRDYRARLYGDPGYRTFLRSIFATSTVCYLGISFTDAYLNEVRSEILSLIDYKGGERPIAYALLPDATKEESAYLRDNEGIEVITYDSQDGVDHSGFDRILESIHEQTNPAAVLGQYVASKRILWVDPHEANNQYGMQVLLSSSKRESTAGIVQVTSPEAALDKLEADHVDLVITHWGHGVGPGGVPNAVHLLNEMHARQLLAPVIVFATSYHIDETKTEALRHGATAFVYRWEALFQEIARVLAPGHETG
jgi:CheY-like chemotaxis protein